MAPERLLIAVFLFLLCAGSIAGVIWLLRGKTASARHELGAVARGLRHAEPAHFANLLQPVPHAR